eukprot:COSAG01_NODE_60136_length_296_cov_0.802030_1_plen_31_part_01
MERGVPLSANTSLTQHDTTSTRLRELEPGLE